MNTERLQAQLKQRDFKLKALLEITKGINNNLSTTELIAQYSDIVEHQLQIPRLVLFNKSGHKWSCALSYGTNCIFDAEQVESYFEGMTDITIVQGHKDPLLLPFDVVIPVFHKSRPLSYLLIGDLDNDEEMRVSPIIKHMRFLQTLTNILSVAIENKILFERSLEQERVNTELALAAQMQALLIGSGAHKYIHFEVATYYKPHLQVGGDFCDFMELNDEECFFCIADVSGKGVSASFLMANLQAQLRAMLEHTEWTLEGLAHDLNRKVMSLVRGERFITLFMGYFNRQTRVLQYLNAGHNPPLLYTGGNLHMLESGTVGIGMLKELPFINRGEISLEPGAAIVCYTDGVIEIENEAGEDFGHEKLGELLGDYCARTGTIEQLVKEITAAIDKHRGLSPYFDDTALLCCRFR